MSQQSLEDEEKSIDPNDSSDIETKDNELEQAIPIPETVYVITSDYSKSLSKYHLIQCIYCQELISHNKNVSDIETFKCSKCIRLFKSNASNFWESEAGNPRHIPEILQLYPLTFIEEQLIALVFVNQYIYNRHTKGGQIAAKGHCIAFMQDFSSFALTLPNDPKNVPLVIYQKKNWKGGVTKDLCVRQFNIRVWLNFLQQNCRVRGYRDAKINEDLLNSLPDNGEPQGLRIIETEIDMPTVDTYERDFNQAERPDIDDGDPAYESAVSSERSAILSEEEQLTETVNSIITGKKTYFSNHCLSTKPN